MPIANPADDELKIKTSIPRWGNPAWHLPFQNNRIIAMIIA
jgi:hypothetical protein